MKKIIATGSFILGILVILTPVFILRVCEYHGYQRMACSYTGLAEVFSGIMIIVISAGFIFSRTSDSFKWLSIVLFVAGLSVIFIPDVLGYCHSSRMPCNYGTVPALRLEGIVVAGLALSGIISSLKKGEGL